MIFDRYNKKPRNENYDYTIMKTMDLILYNIVAYVCCSPCIIYNDCIYDSDIESLDDLDNSD